MGKRPEPEWIGTRKPGHLIGVNRSERNYTALMLIAVGLVVGIILNALDVPAALTVGVVLAFAAAALIAFLRRRTARRTAGAS